MKGDKFIQIKDLKYSYLNDDDSKRVVLDGINLDINEGEFIAVVGKNGSGKSTFALHLNALLVPEEGDVIVDNLNTKDENSIWEIRKRVGMVFQNPDNQLVSSVIEDDVAFGPENIGIDPKEIRIRVDDSLKAVRMSEYAKKAPHLLSGGQKQRIAIAGVLAMKPKCIVFDESTSMLDPKGRAEILDIIKTLHSEGHTIIMITHFMEEASCADRIIVIDNGKVAEDTSPQKLFSSIERIKKYELEMPFAIRLIASIREKGIDIPAEVTTKEALIKYLCTLK